MFKTSLLVAFFVVTFAFAVVAQDVDSDGAELMRSRNVAVVPSARYPTLDSALYRGLEIELLPGYYEGNFSIFASESIRAKKADTVYIDGGYFQNTFTVEIQANLKLKNITVINRQPIGFYYIAAIHSWGGDNVDIENCKIFSASSGLSIAYMNYALVRDNTFTGLSKDAVGIKTALNNILAPGQGSWIYNNHFQSLDIGIDHFELTSDYPPTLSLCKTQRRCTDSNTYTDVRIPIRREYNS